MSEQENIITTIEPPANLPAIKGKADFKAVAHSASQFLEKHMGMAKEQIMSEMGFAIQIAESNPTLYQCTSQSVYYALANIGNMGLTLNPAMKLAYLVPRRNGGKMECCLTPSYRGLIKTCTDPGGVLAIDVGLVFEGDDYEVQEGSGGFVKVKSLALKSRRKMSDEEKTLLNDRERDFWGNLIFAWSKAILHNGAESVDFMPVERLLKVKNLCVKTKRDDSPSNLWKDEWCLKTVIAHHTKRLPKSERAAVAIQAFHNAEGISDYDDIPAHSSRSIEAMLTDDRVEPVCGSCGHVCEDGECHNSSCPEAVPPK